MKHIRNGEVVGGVVNEASKVTLSGGGSVETNINNINEDLDAIKIINSINITLDGSKISNKQFYTRGFEKLGIVSLCFSFVTYEFNPSTWTKIGSIPITYAPSTDFYFTMQESYYDTYNPYVCYVDAQGDIYIRGKSLSSGSYIRGNVTYLKGK